MTSPPSHEQTDQVVMVLKAKSPSALAEGALARRGFSNSDIGCGVHYPEDRDGEDSPIAAGHVEVYGGWGDDFEFQIPEADYLAIVAAFLAERGHPDEAERVGRVAEALRWP